MGAVKHFLRKLAVLLVLVAGAAWFLFDKDPSKGLVVWEPSDGPLDPALLSGREPDVLEDPDAPPPTDEADPEPATAFQEPFVPRPAPGSGPVSGRVLLAGGEPAVGVRVRVRHPLQKAAEASTNDEGAFVLEPEELSGELEVAGEGWYLLGGERQLGGAMVEGYLLIVAPARRVVGRVTDAAGQPLAGVELRGSPPEDVLIELDLSSRPLRGPAQDARTDRDGRFEIASLPDLPGTLLVARRAGYQTWEQAIPVGEGPVRIRLLEQP